MSFDVGPEGLVQLFIDQLYKVFSQYKKPSSLDACSCCLDDNEKKVLLSKPLAELSGPELSEYAAGVFLTVGHTADFKYFLPRILELKVTGDNSWPVPEVALGKLRLAEWDKWVQEDKDAILNVFNAKFEDLVGGSKNDFSDDIDTWICAFGQCTDNLLPWLNQLLLPKNGIHLWAFVNDNLGFFSKGKLANPFWEDAPMVTTNQVTAWLKQETIRALLTEKYGMRFPENS